MASTLPVEELLARRLSSFSVLRACIRGETYFMDTVLVNPGEFTSFLGSRAHTDTRNQYTLAMAMGRLLSLMDPMDVIWGACMCMAEYEHACGDASLVTAIVSGGLSLLRGGDDVDEYPDSLPSSRPAVPAGSPASGSAGSGPGGSGAGLQFTSPAVHRGAFGAPVYEFLLPVAHALPFASLDYVEVMSCALDCAAQLYVKLMDAWARVTTGDVGDGVKVDEATLSSIRAEIARFDRRVKHYIVKPTTLAMADFAMKTVSQRIHVQSLESAIAHGPLRATAPSASGADKVSAAPRAQRSSLPGDAPQGAAAPSTPTVAHGRSPSIGAQSAQSPGTLPLDGLWQRMDAVCSELHAGVERVRTHARAGSIFSLDDMATLSRAVPI